ncbi:GBF-interacting protein 1-like isoform X2 [Morus notabilis]|uniref:GBF-interacting protein 1-like isoform X2 n=1 Tax=Morus notabilis TaxID=981085 RepID=UPI000CECF512|nr:GBF-interacting protein 1-like isoform X2 [Morus notabilis]
MSGGGFRVSIPSSVRKTIQNLKEIAGNHSDDEIYAMLKECSMDPNETAQKLLLQDTFHEVKRKRDRRKENVNNRESTETRWRTGTQGRGGRGGRANFSPRYPSNDAGSGKNPGPGKENGLQGGEKGITPSQTSHETKDKERNSATSSASVVSNGPTTIASGSTSVANASTISVGSDPEWDSTSVGTDNLSTTLHSVDVSKKPITASADDNSYEQPEQSSSSCAVLPMPTSTSTVCFSSSDPVLMPSNDSRVPGAVGAIKREVGHRASCEVNATLHVEKKSTAASEISISSAQVKMPSKSQGVGKGQLTEFSQPSSTSTHVGSSNSRPSSNYSNRSQQGIGTQKGGSNKEWKPKAVQGSGTAGASESLPGVVEANAKSQPVSNILESEDATSKLERMLEEKLEELHLQQRQHVILPNHIHVPESERTKLSFGSFGFSFGVSTINTIGSESDKSSTPLPGTSQGAEENVEEKSSSNQNVIATADEGDYPEHPQSPTHVPENLSSTEGDVSSNATPGPNESKQDTELPSGGQQYSMVNTSSTYSFGLVPPILGSQLAPLENAESQARDVSRLPSFVVQPFDPTSYYAQFYRSGADTDGRLSPFPSPGVATKYNGNVAVLPPPNPQSPQEGGVLSTAGPSPLVTQAAGLMQSSIAVTQQPVPVFRPPAGMHISHYPPNYFSYGHYFPPFYVPPPAIHQFLGNGTFSQQPQAGGVYPAPPAAAATGVKYSVPQYKPGTNTGNSAHIGMTSGYGPYGSSPGGYIPNSATTVGNSTTNDDLGPSQFKENNVYIAGQQSEGSAMWVAAPGRDISSLPTSSFYNLPPQGQHVAFTPAQAGHGTFAGIYHPAQAVTATTVHPLLQQSQTMAGAVDMVGPGGGVYQQPQHTQINWPSNY